MRYFVLGATYIVRLDAGEKIIESLQSLCERDGIGGGHFQGLGAVDRAEIGHYDPAGRAYGWTVLSGPQEIVSLCGNITTLEGKPFVHAHIALGDGAFAVRGGHLKEAVVSATCEITLVRFRDDIGRIRDAASGTTRLALEPAGD